MRIRIAFLAVTTLLIVSGCSSDQPPAKTGTPPTGGTAAPSSPAKGSEEAAASIEVSKEMKDFVDATEQFMIDLPLAKYAAEKVDVEDIEKRDYTEPKIVKSEKRGDQYCYTLSLTEETTKFLFEICWKDGMIVNIKQLPTPGAPAPGSRRAARKALEDESPFVVETSQEMQDFVNGIKSVGIDPGLAKYVAEGVDTEEIKEREYSLPKVVKVEKKDDRDCYTLQMIGGVYRFTFELCWEGGKIVAIKQLEMIETNKLKK